MQPLKPEHAATAMRGTCCMAACLLAVFATFSGKVFAQTSEAVSFPGAAASERFPAIAQVAATLRKPATPAAKMPAIVILHGSGGIDGRGAFYADALNKAGFATLEVFMFAPGQRNREAMNPPSPMPTARSTTWQPAATSTPHASAPWAFHGAATWC